MSHGLFIEGSKKVDVSRTSYQNNAFGENTESNSVDASKNDTETNYTIQLPSSTQLPSSINNMQISNSNSFPRSQQQQDSQIPKSQSQTSIKILSSHHSSSETTPSSDDNNIQNSNNTNSTETTALLLRSPPETRKPVFSLNEETSPSEIDRKAELLAESILTEDDNKADNLDLERVEERIKSGLSRLPSAF